MRCGILRIGFANIFETMSQESNGAGNIPRSESLHRACTGAEPG
jgi:hypothetical protein